MGLLDRFCELTGRDAALVRRSLAERECRRAAAWYGAADGPPAPPEPALSRAEVELLVDLRIRQLLAELPAIIRAMVRNALDGRW